MVTETLPATTQSTPEKRELALLKAIGFDKLSAEQRELALNIANRYDLDPMLRHIVLIDGKPFITRDALLWVAHRSGVFDGIEVTTPVRAEGDKYWRCTATVYRKDMTRPTTYPGRYPSGAKNDEEMCIKVAESMALRRAFNVAAPVVEERWATDEGDDAPEEVRPPKAASLAEIAAERAAAVQPEPEPAPEAEEAVVVEQADVCASASPYGDGTTCVLPAGHEGLCRNGSAESWERKA